MTVDVAALIRHCETVTVPDGVERRPLKLLPWQRTFLKGAFTQDGDVALTIARGGGKTTLCAAIADAALCGPLRSAGGDTIIVASSFSQSRIAFEQVLGGRKWTKDDYRIQNSQAVAAITCKTTGSRVRVIGSDPRRAHGLQPALIIADEPAQWPPSSSERMVAALRTSLGKVKDSRLIAIGTRPAGDLGDHWFSRMLAGEAVGYSQVHAADPDDDPAAESTWLKANPSLKYFPTLMKRMRQDAKDALRNPSLLAEFRSLRLNMGCADTVVNSLLDAGTWQASETDVPVQGPFVLGLDLGMTTAMSAASAYWPETGRLDAFAVFPRVPSLSERGLADGVGGLYVAMAERDELLVRGDRVSDIGGLLDAVRERWGEPVAIVADRWREGELRQALDAAAFPRCSLVVRGMGFKDGGQDVRLFRRAVVDGRVRPVESLLLRSAMGEARTVTDAAGNSKLAKNHEGGRREKARDDAAAASILAVAEGVRGYKEAPTEAPFRMVRF